MPQLCPTCLTWPARQPAELRCSQPANGMHVVHARQAVEAMKPRLTTRGVSLSIFLVLENTQERIAIVKEEEIPVSLDHERCIDYKSLNLVTR